MAYLTLADRLAQVDLFSTMDHETLNRLVSAGATMTFRPSEVIIEQGRTDLGLHLLLEGTGVVEVHGEPVATLEPGRYVGEISLIDGAPRTATVRAGDEGAKTFTISSLSFQPLLDSNPAMGRALLVALCARLRRLEEARAHGPSTS